MFYGVLTLFVVPVSTARTPFFGEGEAVLAMLFHLSSCSSPSPPSSSSSSSSSSSYSGCGFPVDPHGGRQICRPHWLGEQTVSEKLPSLLALYIWFGANTEDRSAKLSGAIAERALPCINSARFVASVAHPAYHAWKLGSGVWGPGLY